MRRFLFTFGSLLALGLFLTAAVDAQTPAPQQPPQAQPQQPAQPPTQPPAQPQNRQPNQPAAQPQNPQPNQPPAQPNVQPNQPQGQAQVGTTVQGKVLRLQGNDQFVVRTNDNKEVILYTNPQTRYLFNNQVGRYSDLRVGSDITAVYGVQDNRYIANSVTMGIAPNATQPAPAAVEPAGQPVIVEGTVLRVVGKDQVVLRTADNKEVTVYVMPQTKYVINEQPAQFTDYTVGTPVRVEYDVRDNRWMARRFLGRPRR